MRLQHFSLGFENVIDPVKKLLVPCQRYFRRRGKIAKLKMRRPRFDREWAGVMTSVAGHDGTAARTGAKATLFAAAASSNSPTATFFSTDVRMRSMMCDWPTASTKSFPLPKGKTPACDE